MKYMFAAIIGLTVMLSACYAKANACVEDVDDDGVVGVLDVGYVSAYWLRNSSQPGWEPMPSSSEEVRGNLIYPVDADINRDEVVGAVDVGIISAGWLQTCEQRYILNDGPINEPWCSGYITYFDLGGNELIPSQAKNCCLIRDMLEEIVAGCTTGEEDPFGFYPFTFPPNELPVGGLCGSGLFPLCPESDPLP